MNTRQKVRQLRLQEWTGRFAEQKASGLTIQQWCEQNDYSVHAYNYWKHILKEEVAEQMLPDIVSLSLPDTVPADSGIPDPVSSNLTTCAIRANCATARLMVNDVVIEVGSDSPEDFLCRLIKAVRYA